MAFTDQPFRNQMISKKNCIHIWQLNTIATTSQVTSSSGRHFQLKNKVETKKFSTFQQSVITINSYNSRCSSSSCTSGVMSKLTYALPTHLFHDSNERIHQSNYELKSRFENICKESKIYLGTVNLTYYSYVTQNENKHFVSD